MSTIQITIWMATLFVGYSNGGLNNRPLGYRTAFKYSNISKFWRIGVPTRDWFSRRILKASNLGWVEARYLKPKILFRRSMNTSPVRNRSNTIVHTQILIRVMAIFSQNASIFVFAFITPDSARYSYPNNSQIPSFFRVAKRGWVIRQNLNITLQRVSKYQTGSMFKWLKTIRLLN